ncbi:cytochrome c-type biogenesis protein CcmE [Sphingomonas jejuensis]|uniref:Cytochrome c-type biogenesis protein CcmE n=1 Tax=Sphingomonas jejuensis TaxID=904715 RepID=A0ABX0XJF5_9SPHN|nr:cytochrome c maturation protein CcmE [Sphingomonas jejuensis]NJC33293.1 cytochrome c-type biogenesis protein CcmE [Sphingomonas jejuensis]
MKAKHQRLVLALVAVGAMSGSALLAMSALGDRAAYFQAPSDVARTGIEPGRAIRLGGMVDRGSISRGGDGVSIRFTVSDGGGRVPVRFTGITPDLFREGSGMVAEGRFGSDGVFVADTILAKHDERYMPPGMNTDVTSGSASPGTTTVAR